MGASRGASPALAGAAAIIAIGAFAASAAGTTSALRPDGDVSSQWSRVGASSAWDALNDTTAQPSAPSSGDYISSGGSGRVTEVSLGTRVLTSETVAGGTAWFYASAGILSSARVEVVWGGSVRGSATVSGGLVGSGGQWRSIAVTPPDQASIDDLRLRFTSTQGSDVSVRAAYFQLDTNPIPPPPPPGSCPLSIPGSTIGMTMSHCTTVASDTASSSDPLPFWGRVECASGSRHQRQASGGDGHATATGSGQGNSAYRRLTVVDGDDVSGERCELGYNWNEASDNGSGIIGPGPTIFYREGQRRVTYASIRIPSSWDVNDPDWRVVFQNKRPSRTTPRRSPRCSRCRCAAASGW